MISEKYKSNPVRSFCSMYYCYCNLLWYLFIYKHWRRQHLTILGDMLPWAVGVLHTIPTIKLLWDSSKSILLLYKQTHSDVRFFLYLLKPNKMYGLNNKIG